MSSGSTLNSSAVLAAARRLRSEADLAEAGLLGQAVEWAHLHVVSEGSGLGATWGDSPVPIAGEGAPLVSEFCIHEFASALGMSPDSGRALIAHALEIHHRLPRVWHRVQAGDLQVWRARRIAEKTLPLSLEAAEHVDRHVAAYAHQVGIAALERLVDETIARHMPELAEELAVRAADGRFVRASTTNRSPSQAPATSAVNSTSPTPSTSKRRSRPAPSSSPTSASTHISMRAAP